MQEQIVTFGVGSALYSLVANFPVAAGGTT